MSNHRLVRFVFSTVMVLPAALAAAQSERMARRRGPGV